MSVAPHFPDSEIDFALARAKACCKILEGLLFENGKHRTNVSNSNTVSLLAQLADVQANRARALILERCRMSGIVVINKG